MEEEYQLNIDEVLYIQACLQQDYDNINETCYDEKYVNMLTKLQNKMCLIKNELNK
tara:strand:- start:209 stop:376 length:168 start_codon:yes stop_codon:yes gene_type:complete